jgi:hypothetical protein
VSAATASGDVILVHYTSQLNLAADTTYTFTNHVSVISVDKDASDAPTAMGTGGWIGHSATAYSIIIAGAYKLFFYGITLRIGGSATKGITLSGSDGTSAVYESCYLWLGSATGGTLIVGSGASAYNYFAELINTTVRFGATAQSLSVKGRLSWLGGDVASAGSSPTTLLTTGNGCQNAIIRGADLSHCGANTLVGSAASGPFTATFDRCKLGASYVAMASQSPANLSSAEVYILDCSSGDTNGLYAYHNALGSMVSDPDIYYTSGAAGQSWKIVTTANAAYHSPFCTPWISEYHSGTSAITPRLEILRDGSTTAFNDDEVWSEWAAKVTASSTRASLYSDRRGLTASAAAQANGAGTGSWTGEGGTAWSGKADSGASLTPAEAGDISGRVCVGAASTTVYVNPQMLTA